MLNSKKKWGEDQQSESKITCSLTVEPTIYIELRARLKIAFLMEEYDNREWLAYLTGSISEKGNYFVEDISIPPHKESCYASAEAEPFHIPEEGCVGVIHSHHKMGAFHSGTDLTHVDRNFPISITVAVGEGTNLKYSAICIMETPCGKPVSLDCTVMYVQPEPDFNAETWLEEAKKNIDKGKFQYQGYTQGGVGVITPAQQNLRNLMEEKEALPETIIPATDTIPTGKRIITTNMVRTVRKAIHESRGVLLTRSEIEDIIQRNPLAYVGMEDSNEA